MWLFYTMKELLDRLLEYYQIDQAEYERITAPVSLNSFSSGHQFDDIDKAVNLVKDIIKKDGKIIIYGDYDADGVMGTSILVKMFQYLNKQVDYYIPNRYNDNYGINVEHAKEYIRAKYDLVITVDNGITAFEPIELLHNAGIKVLVLDHHQNQAEVPLADAICHPTYSHFGDVASSGAFTAFMFSISLLGKIDKFLSTLAAISLVSDMMPLLEYNRSLLRAVINDYKNGEFLAIDLLGDNEPFNEQLIGMKIAPRINAIGRLCDDTSINEIIKYFVSDDKEFILNYFQHILEINDARKELSKFTLDQSLIKESKYAIVLLGEYKEGIIGLAANSIMNSYHVPVVVFTETSDGTLKGSARAPEGFDIVEVFSMFDDILLTHGGHAMAGGCSIKKEDYNEFKRRFIEIAETKPLKKVEHKFIDLGISELTFDNYNIIQSFSPFGESWPAPLFKLKHIKVSALMYSRDHKHVITNIGNRQKLVYFNYPKAELESATFIDVTGYISKKTYQGYTYLEFNVKEMSESK